MVEAYICDAIRTPIGRYGGSLSSIRADDLASVPISALISRNPAVDWEALDDIILGCANQAGEDNRNVARMAGLLAGLPESVGGCTVNRLCGSGLDAVGSAARSIRSGDAEMILAGGVESMSRAPFVMPKANSAFSRDNAVYDTTIGWRFINPRMKHLYGVDSMPETAENVATQFGISRKDQDLFALGSQQKAANAQTRGRFEVEICPVSIPQRKGGTIMFSCDEHPRETTLETLKELNPIVHDGGSVTAGNSSGVNDGAAALILASEKAATRFGLVPRARIVAMATAGVAPRIMGIGPVPATERVLSKAGLTVSKLDLIELNEAFAAQALAVLNQLGIEHQDPRVNPNGGAIAIGHPLGMSGARLVLSATEELCRKGDRYALVTMCIGVGQGISVLLERV